MNNLPKKKILIIEDDRSLQNALVEIMGQAGYQVASAFDGEEGILKLAAGKPDLILLDLILPKIHGFDVLKKLKQAEGTKHISVIVLTNLEGMRDVDMALELGATTYLVKAQYSLEEVVEKIKKAIGD